MPLPDDHTSEPAAAHSRPSSLREARRLFAELSSPIRVDSPASILSDSSETQALPAQASDRPESRQGFPRVPGYHIERPLGEGGGGAVYLACRETSDKPIALKILNARPGDKSAQRAWRELDLLSQVHLPAVPRVLDYGRVEGGPFAGRLYIATEYIDGKPIHEHCHGNAESDIVDCKPQSADPTVQSPPSRLPIRAAVSLLAKTADALHALHERGIIHRDVKPANILIDRHGDPVIIDLGIATLVAADVMETLTRDGAPIGSPAYMAPEQARGERNQISIRSDVYALGATGFFILTGQTPHALEGATLHEAIHRIATQPARDPRAINPDLPKPLAAILSKALAPDAKHRYESAAAFADDLRRWLAGEPVEAGAPTPWRTATRWITRHPVATTAAACIVLALVGVAVTTVAVFVTADYLSNRPARFEVSQDRSKVDLLSRSGSVLHSWENQYAEPFAEIFDRPAHLGGGRVAVVLTREDLSTYSQVRVYELDDLTHPHRQTSAVQQIPIPEWRGDQGGGDVFAVPSVIPADVFPDIPGTELIAAHNCERFPAIIRIYDLDLNILYDAWHPGALSPVFYWLPGPPGRLVCGASNNEGGDWAGRVKVWEEAHPGQTFDWSAIGAAAPKSDAWPLVLFVIQPEPNQRRGVVWGKHRDPQVILDWYKFIHPADYDKLYRPEIIPARNPPDRHRHFGIHLNMKGDPNTGFDVQVDGATGAFVGEPFSSDVVRQAHGEWIERFRLVEAPLEPSYAPGAP